MEIKALKTRQYSNSILIANDKLIITPKNEKNEIFPEPVDQMSIWDRKWLGQFSTGNGSEIGPELTFHNEERARAHDPNHQQFTCTAKEEDPEIGARLSYGKSFTNNVVKQPSGSG